MRIVAGRHRGRRLAAPHGDATRPTSDRVREAIYNVLSHGLDVEIEGAVVLDVFAGSGALGIEALSRGAGHAIFVDMARPALDAVGANVETVGEDENATILRRDVRRFGAKPAEATPATLAFFDPPYHETMVEPALIAAVEGGWLAPGACVVVETAEDESFGTPDQFEALDERRYGKTLVRFFRYGG